MTVLGALCIFIVGVVVGAGGISAIALYYADKDK